MISIGRTFHGHVGKFEGRTEQGTPNLLLNAVKIKHDDLIDR